MPRIDAGWKILDRPLIEAEGYEKVLNAALSSGGVLVTYPSIVTVRGRLRSTRLALAIGSVILPPDAGFEGYTVTRPEWVEGCIAGSSKSIELELAYAGTGRRVDGRLIAYHTSDPVALSINGEKGVFIVRGVLSKECVPLVLLGNQSVVGIGDNGRYCTAISEGPSIEFLNFIVRLYTSCRGR